MILENGSPIRDFLIEEIRSKISLLQSAFDAINDALLPKVAEEWKCIKCSFKHICKPSSVIRQDSEIAVLHEKGLVITIESP